MYPYSNSEVFRALSSPGPVVRLTPDPAGETAQFEQTLRDVFGDRWQKNGFYRTHKLLEPTPLMGETQIKCVVPRILPVEQSRGSGGALCPHEYTLDNLRFALVAEPANQATQDRYLAVQQARAAGQPTVPAPLALETATNPFLRCAIPTLIEAAEKFAGHPLADGAEVFAAVRRWKDSLD